MIDTNMTVNHIDGNRLNNRVDNLEWLSRADNIRYGFKNGQYSTCKQCTLIRDGKEYIFYSLSQASIFLGRNVQYMSSVLKRNKIPRDKNGNIYLVK